MKHRDRVLMALNHEQPDRCPMQVSFTPEFASRLRREMQQKNGTTHNPHGGGNTYELERALGEDMLLTSVGWANCYYQEAGDYTDEWGVGWKQSRYTTRFGEGSYTEMATHPLADNAAVETYRPPDPSRPELYQDAARTLRDFKDEYWIVGVTVTTIFECAWALRGPGANPDGLRAESRNRGADSGHPLPLPSGRRQAAGARWASIWSGRATMWAGNTP